MDHSKIIDTFETYQFPRGSRCHLAYKFSLDAKTLSPGHISQKTSEAAAISNPNLEGF